MKCESCGRINEIFEDDRFCSCCGTEYLKVGIDVSRLLALDKKARSFWSGHMLWQTLANILIGVIIFLFAVAAGLKSVNMPEFLVYVNLPVFVAGFFISGIIANKLTDAEFPEVRKGRLKEFLSDV